MAEDKIILSKLTNDVQGIKGQFKQAANDNNRNISSISKDIARHFSSQQSQIKTVSSNVEDVENTTQKLSAKIDSAVGIINNDLSTDNEMLSIVKTISRNVEKILEEVENDNGEKTKGNGSSGIGNVAGDKVFKNIIGGIEKRTAGAAAALGVGGALLTGASDKIGGGSGEPGKPGDANGNNSKGEDKNKPSSGNEKMATIKTKDGKAVQVHPEYAKNFEGFINELESTGYKIKSIGGYANRNIAGTGTASWHSAGMAIDINPDANPVTKGEPGRKPKTDMPENVGQIAAKYGLGWGGAWDGEKQDAMHFSLGEGPGAQFRGDRSKLKASSGGGGTPAGGGGGESPKNTESKGGGGSGESPAAKKVETGATTTPPSAEQKTNTEAKPTTNSETKSNSDAQSGKKVPDDVKEEDKVYKKLMEESGNPTDISQQNDLRKEAALQVKANKVQAAAGQKPLTESGSQSASGVLKGGEVVSATGSTVSKPADASPAPAQKQIPKLADVQERIKKEGTPDTFPGNSGGTFKKNPDGSATLISAKGDKTEIDAEHYERIVAERTWQKESKDAMTGAASTEAAPVSADKEDMAKRLSWKKGQERLSQDQLEKLPANDTKKEGGLLTASDIFPGMDPDKPGVKAAVARFQAKQVEKDPSLKTSASDFAQLDAVDNTPSDAAKVEPTAKTQIAAAPTAAPVPTPPPSAPNADVIAQAAAKKETEQPVAPAPKEADTEKSSTTINNNVQQTAANDSSPSLSWSEKVMGYYNLQEQVKMGSAHFSMA